MDLETTTTNLVWEDTAARLDTNQRSDREILSSQLTNSFKRTKENLLKNLLQTLPYPIKKPGHKDGTQLQQPAGPPNQAIHAGALGRLKQLHHEHHESVKLLCEVEEAFAAELKLLQNPDPPPPPPTPPPPPPLLAGATPPPPTAGDMENGKDDSSCSSCSGSSSGVVPPRHVPSRHELRRMMKRIERAAKDVGRMWLQMAKEERPRPDPIAASAG